MDEKYVAWIREHGLGCGAPQESVLANAYGKCASVTLAMASAFPELRRARGFYHCDRWGRRQHWWCVAPDGTVVDPTAEQFPSMGLGEYDEVKDGEEDRIPVGKCMNCGEELYAHDESTYVCSDYCELAVRRDMGI